MMIIKEQKKGKIMRALNKEIQKKQGEIQAKKAKEKKMMIGKDKI